MTRVTASDEAAAGAGHGTTDAELVEAFVNQKRDAALLEIVRRYQIPIFRRLSLILQDPDDAEATCEKVFVLASQRLSEWPRETTLHDWLLEVATEVGSTQQGEATDPASPRLVDPAAFFKHSVHRALHSLDALEREVLLAVDLEGRSVENVATAKTLGVAEVRATLDRARQHFTDKLAQKATDEGANQTEPIEVEPGQVIDKRYRVESLLGVGGMASVFRAEHLTIGRKVALKTLRPTNQTKAMVKERFVREAQVLGRLAHPNFVDISDFGESSRGLSYLVMELLDGRPLSAEIFERTRLPPARALAITRQIANGLAFAHGKGIIHRDIKPANIVILNGTAGDGFAKILDLGIAATGSELEGSSSNLFGTPEYMAPEQITGDRIDGRTDLYALGVTLFEMLTGQLPFQGATGEYILAQHITRPPPRLADVAPDIAARDPLQALLDSCLAKEPAGRVRDAGALAAQLEAVSKLVPESGEPVPLPLVAAAPASATRSPAPAAAVRPKTRLGWVLGVLAAVAAAAALTYVALRGLKLI